MNCMNLGWVGLDYKELQELNLLWKLISALKQQHSTAINLKLMEFGEISISNFVVK